MGDFGGMKDGGMGGWTVVETKRVMGGDEEDDNNEDDDTLSLTVKISTDDYQQFIVSRCRRGGRCNNTNIKVYFNTIRVLKCTTIQYKF